MILDIKSSATHTNSSIKLRQDQTMRNTHQNASSQKLSKYNRLSMCDCGQKCHLTINKGIITMKHTRYVLINVMTLRNDQENFVTCEMT